MITFLEPTPEIPQIHIMQPDGLVFDPKTQSPYID